MFIEILVGSGVMLVSVAVAGVSFWVMELMMVRTMPWFLREPHRPKLMLALLLAAIWSLWLVTAGVWIWAIAFRAMDLFPTLESSVYFALVVFTTLGFGDMLLPEGWRLLSGMAAANGLLNIGLLIAVLTDALRHVRAAQLAARMHQHPQAGRVDALTGRNTAAKSGARHATREDRP